MSVALTEGRDMRIEAIKSIDDYEAFMSATIAPWSPEQRLALGAAMAERGMPTYAVLLVRGQAS